MNKNMFNVGWGGECVITEVKHTCPQPVTGLVSRLVFTGSIPVVPTNLWFQKHLVKQDDHLADVGIQRGGCQQLLQQKGACFLLNKKRSFKWD